jgi:hypothetical protein
MEFSALVRTGGVAVAAFLISACGEEEGDSGDVGWDGGNPTDADDGSSDGGDGGESDGDGGGSSTGGDGGDDGGEDHCEPTSKLVDRVDPARMLADLEFLTGLQERRTHESQTAAADYIRSELSALDGVEIHDHTYDYEGETWVNVQAWIAGTDLPDEHLMLGGHYDSTSGHPTLAPGADDNASGTVALLESARILAVCPPARTVVWVFFSNEEKGAIGSSRYAPWVRGQIPPEDLIGFVTVDMVGYGPDDEDLDLGGRTADSEFIHAMADAVEGWTDLDVRTRIDDHCG